jgi:hypothetical protein
MSIWPGARILHLVMLLTVLTQQSQVPAQIRPAVAVWAPAANEVLVGSQSGLQVCAWPMLTLQRQVPVEPQQILDLCLAGDQRRLLLTGGTAGESGMLQLLDLQTEQILLTCTPHTDRITQTCWHSSCAGCPKRHTAAACHTAFPTIAGTDMFFRCAGSDCRYGRDHPAVAASEWTGRPNIRQSHRSDH